MPPKSRSKSPSPHYHLPKGLLSPEESPHYHLPKGLLSNESKKRKSKRSKRSKNRFMRDMDTMGTMGEDIVESVGEDVRQVLPKRSRRRRGKYTMKAKKLSGMKGGRKSKKMGSYTVKKKTSKKTQKGGRKKSKYNIFMKQEIQRLKKDPKNKGKPHSQIFSMAAENWKGR